MSDREVLTSAAESPSEELQWQVRLGDRHAERRWIVIAMALLTIPIGWFLLRHPLLALLGPAVILVACGDLFLPIRYRLGAKGVTSTCGFVVSEIEWTSVKSLRFQKDGVVVSPLEREGRMEAFRGVYLRYDGNEAAVLAKIGEFWNEHEGVLGTGTDGGANPADDR